MHAENRQDRASPHLETPVQQPKIENVINYFEMNSDVLRKQILNNMIT